MEKSEDQEATKYMGGLWQNLHHYVNQIKGVFFKEGIALPVGFTI